MGDTGEPPIYTPFFGVMGATSAMVFSGKLMNWIDMIDVVLWQAKKKKKKSKVSLK